MMPDIIVQAWLVITGRTGSVVIVLLAAFVPDWYQDMRSSRISFWYENRLLFPGAWIKGYECGSGSGDPGICQLLAEV